jgi:hypothetical protein
VAEIGTIQQTIALFKAAFDGLNVIVKPTNLERLAVLVHEAMTVNARSFHTIEHVFTLSDPSNPIQALAALFHDVVYFEVDQGFTPRVFAVIEQYIHQANGDIYLKPAIPSSDRLFDMTLRLFGFSPGQMLPAYNGQNEFLSALLMGKLLEDFVSIQTLVKVIVCIEATIPFRGMNGQGRSPAHVLDYRLNGINREFNLALINEEIQTAIKNAVMFSNRDVMSFSESDTGRFLDNTWKLLPELNPSLRLHGIYTIRSYRQGLEKMEEFLVQLNPDTIFNRYADVPEPGTYERMLALAYRNVATARQYLGIKLLAATILEALAEITGGDVPVALFIGGIEGEMREGQRQWEDYLPDIPTPTIISENSTLFGLLAFGRASSSSFDMQHSPLSLFLFKSLGWERVHILLKLARKYYVGQVDARTFLDKVQPDVMHSIVSACAEMAITRQAELREYAASRMRITV